MYTGFSQSMSITAVPISMVRVRALIGANEGNGDPAGARVMDSEGGAVGASLLSGNAEFKATDRRVGGIADLRAGTHHPGLTR